MAKNPIEDDDCISLELPALIFLIAFCFLALHVAIQYYREVSTHEQCQDYYDFLSKTETPIVSFNSLNGKCYKFTNDSWIQQTPLEEQLSK